MFAINQTTGALTPTTPAVVNTAGSPFQVTIAPSGKFAYVVNNLYSSPYGTGVTQFTVDPNSGLLTENLNSVVTAGDGPTAIAVDPTSHYAYVVNRGDGSVSMYTINQTTGVLSLNITKDYPTGFIGLGGDPFRITFDPSGKFVYVTNEASSATVFTVASDGTLSNVGTTGVQNGALSTAFATSH